MTKCYGICDCGRWGEAPSNFSESLHFLKCYCGKICFLQIHDPREAGYKEINKFPLTVVKQ